jgi:hypothetical protein
MADTARCQAGHRRRVGRVGCRTRDAVIRYDEATQFRHCRHDRGYDLGASVWPPDRDKASRGAAVRVGSGLGDMADPFDVSPRRGGAKTSGAGARSPHRNEIHIWKSRAAGSAWD